MLVAILLVSGGAGDSGFCMTSVQRLCGEGGRWVTFLCEKDGGGGGVSEVDNHEWV